MLYHFNYVYVEVLRVASNTCTKTIGYTMHHKDGVI